MTDIRIASGVSFNDQLPLSEQRRIAANNLTAIALYVELESVEISTEQLVILTLIAWKKYNDAATIVSSGVTAIRKRMTAGQYSEFLKHVPGFQF